MLEQLINHCSKGMKAISFETDEELIHYKQSLHLLTDKPVLYVANTNEGTIANIAITTV